MTQEALKLALDALLHAHHEDEAHPKTLEAITAIKEALAQTQEPVAIKRMKEWIEYLKRKSDFGQHMKIPSEMSAGTCWELAIELEQFINTTPPQRTWVGLTDDEIAQGCKESWVTEQAWQSAVWWAEDKLKEKNT